ncbi:TPA: DUF1542 domain-containing protein [Streptococcus suis]
MVSKLDDSGKDTSGNSDDQGGNSTKFNINIVGTAPATAGTGIYYLRVGDDNYPSGPKGKKAADHPTNPNAAEENVSVTPITITFVDKVKPITPIPVADQAHLTPTEKKAVVDAVKEANPGNAKLQALPESAFTVNSDGSVSVNYSGENVDGATDTIKNATTKLAGTQNEAKVEIDRKLAENKKAIEEKRDEAIAEINDDIYLTDVQKEVAREAVTAAAGDALKNLDTKATEAKENIDKATTVSEINNAKTDGEAALDNAEAVGEKSIDWTKEKERAKAEVENQSTDALKIINNNPNLSYEEKKAYFDNINATKETAIDNIDKAKDSGDITVAIEDAVKASETEVLKAAKQDALNKLEKDAAKAKEDVADNSNLTKEQLEKALEDIQNDLDKAKAAVNEAATPDAVQKEEDKGVAAIAKDVLDATKQNALNQLEKDAARAKEDVAKNPNLTKEQLEKALEGIQNDLDKAKTAINEAATSAAVQEEMNKGVTALAKDVLDAAKQDAKNKIDKEAESAKKAIDTNLNLTPEEKESAKKVIDTDAQAATAAIDKASTPDAVQVEEDKGVAAINLITAKADAKGAVAAKLADEIKKLEDKQAEAEKAIDASTMTEEEKAIAKKALQDVVDKGKAELEDAARVATNEIHEATTTEKAKAAALAGEKSLTDAGKKVRDAVELAKDKELAKEAIRTEEEEATKAVEKLAEDTRKAIEENPNLSDEDKQAEIKKLTDAVAKTLETIRDNATTAMQEAEKAQALADLEKAKETQKIADKAAIDRLTILVKDGELEATKRDVLNQLEKDAARAKEDIAKNPNLTKEQVDKALEDVQKDLDKAKTAINEAVTSDAVQAEMDKGVAALAKDVLDAAKQDAKNKIAKDAAAAKEAIDANPNLSDAEKEASKKAVDADAKAATDAIDASTSPVEAQSAEDKGVGSIAQDVLDAAKQDAKNKIAKEAESAKSAIDSNPNLTDAAKEAAKSEIDKAVEEAIVLINGVRTYQELEKIKLPMAALIKPAAKVTPVVDPNNLTEKEIARIKTFLKENNNLPEGTEINVSKDASVTIKYPDGTIDLLSPVEVVKQADKTAPTVANDGKGNIVIVPSEKAVELVVSYVDNNGKSQTVVVTKGTDGLWTASNTVVIVDPVTGQVIVPGSVIKPGTVVTAYSKDEVGNSSDSAEAEVVAVDENNSAAGVKVKSVTTNANNVEKKAKQLPNTGEEANSATSLGLVALGLGLALLAAKRRRDEEA